MNNTLYQMNAGIAIQQHIPPSQQLQPAQQVTNQYQYQQQLQQQQQQQHQTQQHHIIPPHSPIYHSAIPQYLHYQPQPQLQQYSHQYHHQLQQQQPQSIYQTQQQPVHSPYLTAVLSTSNNNTNASNNNLSNSSQMATNNSREYGESTTTTSVIPPSVSSCMTPTMPSQVMSPLIVGTPTSGSVAKRKLEDDGDFSLLKVQPLLVSSPLLTPVTQSPGLTSVQLAFQNTTLSNPPTPLSMSPSLSPSMAPMSPSKKSKNSRSTSKSKWSEGEGSGRWPKVGTIVKGPWKDEEDAKLIELVNKNGPKEWSTIASKIPGRIGKQCRERWFNHLSPDVRKTNWTPEEDRLIIESHQELGNKWTAISKLLDGRPANAIKNHWNSTLVKRIGADIRNHPPSTTRDSKSGDDDDDDDDEDIDTQSPALSPISLYPQDNALGKKSQLAHHTMASSTDSSSSSSNYNIPPFVLSDSISNSVPIQTHAQSSSSLLHQQPLTHQQPLQLPQQQQPQQQQQQQTGTIVAPQIIRLQNSSTTPSSSTSSPPPPTQSNNNNNNNNNNSSQTKKPLDLNFPQQQHEHHSVPQQQQTQSKAGYYQGAGGAGTTGGDITNYPPSHDPTSTTSNYWEMTPSGEMPNHQTLFTADFHVFENPSEFLFFGDSDHQHLQQQPQQQQQQNQHQQQNQQNNMPLTKTDLNPPQHQGSQPYDLNNLFNNNGDISL
ncbi:myb domain-containing protein [Cavenderia fasciculata]|uniref:Myb domain-containing protein n=1 Tax=Cavenderia fasciculata TaxID=261658 RepID=F4Q6H9_CACFS|nr:myb domain-containing protein [Cavenderia fasciculata]EGG16489.1 myb domain-containing protein [Cavenderia fasciculata]|eukprot:XP_004354889.1 myb domain-containing protein [Cavenderia fasciculata]